MIAPTRNSERRTGVPNRVESPDLRFSTITGTLGSSSGPGHRVAAHRRDQQRADHERCRVDQERPRAGRTARQQAGAGEPDRRRAERRRSTGTSSRPASSSSLAISGMRLSWAGSKNCLMPALSEQQQEQPGDRDRLDADDQRRSAPTTTAWIRHVQIMIRLRSWRSTKTPASSPTTRLGTAVTISVSPTASAELGLAKDVDPGSEVGERGAGGRDQLGGPQQREVAPAEHREHRGGRRGRCSQSPSTGSRLRHPLTRSLAPAIRAAPRVGRPSLANASRHRDAFAQEQRLLARQLPVAIDPAVAAVATERPVRRR